MRILAFLLFSTMQVSIARADYLSMSRWSLEGSFGIQNIEIENPNASKAVSEGYGGGLSLFYTAYEDANYHFAFRVSVDYAELENKANTSSLNEETRHLSFGPGAELRVYRFLLGLEYVQNQTTIDMSGALANTVRARFTGPKVFIGYDLPLGTAWDLRFYYVRSQGDLPSSDSGLPVDSPWAQERFLIALKYNFGRGSFERSYTSPEVYPERIRSSENSASDSSPEASRVYRPVRYSPRPSRYLGN